MLTRLSSPVALIVLVASVLLTTLFWAGCQSGQSTDLWAQAKKRGYLTIGTSVTFPPYGYLDDKGEPQGFDISIHQELAKRLLGDPKAVRYVYLTVPSRMAALNSHRVDFILGGYTMTEQRKRYVRFTTPYYTTFLTMIVNRDSGITHTSQLTGKKVAFDFGGTSEMILKEQYPQFTKVGYHSLAEELTALEQHRVDAIIHIEDIGIQVMKKKPGMVMLTERLAVHQFGAGFVKTPEGDVLYDKVESALNAMAKEGLLDKLALKWMSRKATFKDPEKTLDPIAFKNTGKAGDSKFGPSR